MPQSPATLRSGHHLRWQPDAPAPMPQPPVQQQRTSVPLAPETWQPQQGDRRERTAATATPAAARNGSARTRRGRRAQGLSIYSRPRRAHGFRLRRRLVVHQGMPPAASGKAAEREWWASSSGETSSGGGRDDHGAGSWSGPESGGALGSEADSGTRALPGGTCGCSSSGRPWTPETSMPCGDSHCSSSSSCSVCSGGSSDGEMAAYRAQRQCNCRPPSSARQVRLCPDHRAQQTILAPGRLVCRASCVGGSTAHSALCQQVLGKRREPPCHDLPAAMTGSQSGPGSARQPLAHATGAPDCGLALRRLQEDLQRFRCFSSLRDDEAAGGHGGHMAAGPACN
jgi:hypothetical protein